MAASHPKLERRGSEGSYTLVLTDPEGNDVMESSETFDTEVDAEIAIRLVEDSVRYALPVTNPPIN